MNEFETKASESYIQGYNTGIEDAIKQIFRIEGSMVTTENLVKLIIESIQALSKKGIRK